MAAKQITLKLLVNKESNRVVFAESYKDFVDHLLGFLTVTMGTVVQLSDKQTKLGCMDMLYKSVEDLDEMHLQTKQCKTMLMDRVSRKREEECELYHNYYICPTQECATVTHRLISTWKNAQCRCGQKMNKGIRYKRTDVSVDDKEAYVKGSDKFLITDDLKILPVSTVECLSLIAKAGSGDGIALEEREVNITLEEVSQLFKHLLSSKTPLSDMFLPKGDIGGENGKPASEMSMKLQNGRSSNKVSRKTDWFNKITLKLVQCLLHEDFITIKLVRCKSKGKLLYAEAREDFVDLLFSFLTLPLGKVAELLGRKTSIGWVDNLYESVEDLKGHMKSEQLKAKLLDPKLPPFYGCANQLLRVEEEAPPRRMLERCEECYLKSTALKSGKCSHGLDMIDLYHMNPKLPGVITKSGGGFVKGPARFKVTDDLHVEPLSAIASISILSRSNLPLADLEEQTVNVGKEEALSLLKASLVSKTALSDVFGRIHWKNPVQTTLPMLKTHLTKDV